MKDFNIIASFNNPKIKLVEYVHDFVYSDVQMNFLENFNFPIEDKNIIPVAVRVLYGFPAYNANISILVHTGGGSRMGGLFSIRNPDGDDIFRLYPICGSLYSPLWEWECLGQVARPLSENDGLIRMNTQITSTRSPAFGENIDAQIMVYLFYIPIRY